MNQDLTTQYQEYLKYCLMESIPALPYKEWVSVYFELEYLDA